MRPLADALFGVAALAMLAAASVPAPAHAAGSRRAVTVDASSVTGVIRPFTQYNGAPEEPPVPVAPVTGPAQDTGFAVEGSFRGRPATPEQAALFYRQVGITGSRTHDSGGGDTMYNVKVNPNVIFPDKNADPSKPESYNFAASDLVISSMVKNGVEPFFRVGDGWDGFLPDFEKYAEVIRHVVLHYNKGWANGFRYGIKYWEFWNEPDFNLPGRAQFFAGTPEQYYEFYGKVVKAIKAADANAWVGGPATASDVPAFREPFLEYLKANDLPLDFYTFHYYSIGGSDPMDFNRMTDKIRAALVATGFPEVPIMVTEYGYDLFAPSKGMQRPAFFSAALAYMQDTSMDRAYYHAAGVGPLFNADGITPPGLVFQAHGSLQATPDRLKASGADTYGFSVLAGRANAFSADTDREIRILITNYEIPEDRRVPYKIGESISGSAPYAGDLTLNYPRAQVRLHILPRRAPVYRDNKGYDLTVQNLPDWASAGYTVTRYRLDDKHAMTALDTTTGNERTLRLSADLPAPAVELIVIRAQSAGPATREGTWRLAPGR